MAFQKRGIFSPEEAHPRSEGESCHLPGPLNPNTEGDQSCPKHLLQLRQRHKPLSLGLYHLVVHTWTWHVLPPWKNQAPLEYCSFPPLSPLTVSRAWDDWFLSVTQFVGYVIYIICWLNWERTIVVCLNLSWTKAVCQIDSYGWTINSSQIFQNGFVRPQPLYLGTKLKRMQ